MRDEKSAARDHKETQGMREDIDEETALDDVKAPNLFERAKEEVEALIQTIHSKNESPTHGTREKGRKEERNQENPNSGPDCDVRKPNFIEKAKETIEKIMHHEKSPHHHHKETHGMSDDIDESTPIDEVKGPSVFERAKEEIEAVFQGIHPKKEH
ncbi:hypothetical protein L484_027301 [Morus notabilis]|uniref:Uncharacterized protein n=1 Tax=Morus notabilis TaxID=981085 RepID=W9R622_9ROSA|nr:uncharacterized protein LOC21409924 isoform X2 [Morus notabilis]EXB38867.1 hypothetical protein L484_027301 [Morus notabilis]